MANVDIAALIVRGCCETDKADPDHQDTVCINVGDLSRVVIGVLDDEQPNGGAGAEVQQMDELVAAYNEWPADIRKKLSLHDLRRMGGWKPPAKCVGAEDARDAAMVPREPTGKMLAEAAKHDYYSEKDPTWRSLWITMYDAAMSDQNKRDG